MVEIHLARSFAAGGFFGTRTGKKRTMQESHLHFSAVAGNRDRKEAGVLVVHMDEIDALIRSKGGETEAFPMHQILRNGEGNPRANRRECRIGHHVALKGGDERDAWILAASAAMRRPLVIGFRLERNAQPLDSAGIASMVKFDTGNTDSGKIPLSHEPRKQVKMPIRATRGGRIQNAFDLLRVAGLRLQEHP